MQLISTINIFYSLYFLSTQLWLLALFSPFELSPCLYFPFRTFIILQLTFLYLLLWCMTPMNGFFRIHLFERPCVEWFLASIPFFFQQAMANQSLTWLSEKTVWLFQRLETVVTNLPNRLFYSFMKVHMSGFETVKVKVLKEREKFSEGMCFPSIFFRAGAGQLWEYVEACLYVDVDGVELSGASGPSVVDGSFPICFTCTPAAQTHTRLKLNSSQ